MLAAVTAIETKLVLTVRFIDPVTPWSVAVIVHVPCAFAVTMPPAATVAMFVSEDAQVAVLVRFCVLLLLKTPVAVICWLTPEFKEVLAPDTWILERRGLLTVLPTAPPPQAANSPNIVNIPANRTLLMFTLIALNPAEFNLHRCNQTTKSGAMLAVSGTYEDAFFAQQQRGKLFSHQ